MRKKLSIFFCIVYITIMSLSANIFAEGNLVKNGSFEDVQNGMPTGWTISTYNDEDGAAEFNVVSDEAYDGSNCVSVTNNVQNDSRYMQTVSAQPNKNYKLSCYIKAENINDSGNGAVLSIEGQLAATPSLRDTGGSWEYVEMYAKTGEGVYSFNVTVGVGGYSAESTGKGYFDNVTVEEIDTIPEGAIVAIVENPYLDNSSSDNQSESDSDTSENEKKSGTSTTVWLILVVCILITAAAIYNTFKSSSSEKDSESDDSVSFDDDKDSTTTVEDSETSKEKSEEKSDDTE